MAAVFGVKEKSPNMESCSFQLNGIRTALTKQKPGNHEVNGNFSSDHLINARDDCVTRLACLPSSIIFHVVAPVNFLESTIIPSLKDDTLIHLILVNVVALRRGRCMAKYLIISCETVKRQGYDKRISI